MVSWDAVLYDATGGEIASWNYTHNCNGMANFALDDTYQQVSVFDEVFRVTETAKAQPKSWWQQLNGMNGPDSERFLTRILDRMQLSPALYRAMNPDNGWGDFDSFRGVLVEMLEACLSAGTPGIYWEVTG